MENEPPIDEVEIFHRARELKGNERDAFLNAACRGDLAKYARILRMLASPDDFMEIPPLPDIHKPEEPGDRLGPYKLLEQIGEGGFGTVWMAEQETPVRRRLALKIIKMGMDTKEVIARFEQERQALAMMDHPNIAKVFDAGATKWGRPYFVMELIRGIKITAYCDKHGLGMRERLELFMKVCRAVQHAHQKGIIHRDLKPSNILVSIDDGEAVPKVIDFGVAKAMQGRLSDKSFFTSFDQMIGTLMYMSPEQAEMTSLDIDTRSDIYSLGVLLYELLTGRTPINSETIEQETREKIVQLIRDVDPPRPSARIKTLTGEELTTTAKRRHTEPAKLLSMIRGDLDWIVMKCLEKDRKRRYDSANFLALDIQRHLANESVIARPPTSAYLLGRFIRRNRLAVGAAGAVAAALIIGAAVSLWQASVAVAARDAKEVALQKARAAEEDTKAFSDFLVKRVLAAARPKDVEGGLGFDVTVVNALEQAEKRLEGDFAGRPRAEAVARDAIGVTWETLGRQDEAARQLERAVALREHESRPDDPGLLKALNDLAVVYQKSGLSEKALPLYEKVLAKRRETLPPDHADVILSMSNLAGPFYDLGRVPEALALYEQALEAGKATLGRENPNTLKIMSNLARVWRDGGNAGEAFPRKALPLYKDAYETSATKLGEDNADTLTCLNNLAVCYEQAGEIKMALPMYEKAWQLSRKALGDAHADTLTSMNNLAGACRKNGHPSRAIELYEEALKAGRIKPGPDHRDTLNTMFDLGVVYEESKETDKAIALYLEVTERRTKILGPDHRSTLKAKSYLAVAYSIAGDFKMALPLCEQVFASRKMTLGPANPDTLKSLNNLARAHRELSQFPESLDLFEHLLAELNNQERLGEGYPQAADIERQIEEVRPMARKADDKSESASVRTEPK